MAANAKKRKNISTLKRRAIRRRRTRAESQYTVKKVFAFPLWQQVLWALALGVIAGLIFKEQAEQFKVLGTIFMNLIKMVIVPLIFFALVSGITSMDDPKNFKRVGFKGIVAYLSTAAFAVLIGITAAHIFQPGVGLQGIDLSQFGALPEAAKSGSSASIKDFFLGLISTNAIRSMTEDNFLQVVFFAIFVGVSMNLLGSKVAKAREITQEFASIFFKMIESIVKLAPMAVFGYISWMVGTMGFDVIKTLGWLVVTVLAACLFQYILFGVMIRVFAKLNPLPFYKKLVTTQLMAFSTSSSKATLSTAMREIETKLGVSKQSTNFLMPLGASVNMDGTAIYLGICAIFFAQMFPTEVVMDLHHYLILIITCTLGSIGAAGIPSGSIIFMGMVLSSVGIPMEGIALILGVDRILDMVRTTINITGDCAITMIIDKTEGTMNVARYNKPYSLQDDQ